MAASDASPYPIKNQAYRVTFPLLDADGDLVTGAAGLDSEVSKDGATFADATNEATEIATSSGMYYLDLTATEMNADTVAIIVKTSTSDAKTTPIVLYPVTLSEAMLGVNSVQWAGAATATDDVALATAPSNFADLAITATTGQVTIGTNNDKTGYALSAAGVDDVWDEPMAAHGIAATSGKYLTDIFSIVGVNLDTTITSRAAPADIVSGGAITTSGGAVSTVTDVTNRVTANSDQIAGDATAATNLSKSALGVVSTTVNDASPTATSFVTALTETTNDHYKGRIIVFTSGAMSGQATDITAYDGTTKAVTVTALTEAPPNGAPFVIV